MITHDLDGCVADLEARLADEQRNLSEELDAGRTCPLGTIGAEVRSQITHTCGGQERIAERVRGNVAVRVAGKAGWFVGEVEAREEHGRPDLETVDVDPDPGAVVHRTFRPCRHSFISVWASIMSKGSVIFMASREPATSATS